MTNELYIDDPQKLDKILQRQAEEQRQTQDKTMRKLEDMLQGDLRVADRRQDDKQSLNREALQQDINKLKEIATSNMKAEQSYIRNPNDNKILINDAIRETEQMVRLSQDAVKMKGQIYTKQSDDVVQLSKYDTTPTTKTSSFVENYAAVSHAIIEDERVNYKLQNVSQEVGIKQQSPKDQEKDQVEINNANLKKTAQKKKMDMSMDMYYSSSHQESKGKQLAEEKREELTEKNIAKAILPDEDDDPKPQKVNKLRAKFRKNSTR